MQPVLCGMKTGKVLRRFSTRDGRKVILRTLRWEDLDDLLEMINSLVKEKADIARDSRVTREEEIDWLGHALGKTERGETIYVIAEIDGKIAANSEIHRNQSGYDKHVGVIGIAVKREYREIGIGTEMMRTLIELGRSLDLKVLWLCVFASNKRAIHVYEKVGFKETGRIPLRFFKGEKFVDEIVMTRMME